MRQKTVSPNSEKIRSLRLAKSWTQEELADKAKISKRTIENAEAVQSTPILMNGTLKGAERDVYRVYGKAGEARVFEVEARRAGSVVRVQRSHASVDHIGEFGVPLEEDRPSAD